MTERKTDMLQIRVQESYKHALSQLADEEGEAISVVVRRILRDGLKKRGCLKTDKNVQIGVKYNEHQNYE